MGRLPLPPFTKLMRWARGQAIEVKDATEAWGAAEAENTEAENPEAEKKRYRSRATRGKYLGAKPLKPRMPPKLGVRPKPRTPRPRTPRPKTPRPRRSATAAARPEENT